jgi:hypothetical protein
MNRVARELRNQYLLGYQPGTLKHDGKWPHQGQAQSSTWLASAPRTSQNGVLRTNRLMVVKRTDFVDYRRIYVIGCISHYKCKLDIRHCELCLSRLRGSFGRTEKSVSMPGRMRKRLAVGLGQRTSNAQKSTTSGGYPPSQWRPKQSRQATVRRCC